MSAFIASSVLARSTANPRASSVPTRVASTTGTRAFAKCHGADSLSARDALGGVVASAFADVDPGALHRALRRPRARRRHALRQRSTRREAPSQAQDRDRRVRQLWPVPRQTLHRQRPRRHRHLPRRLLGRRQEDGRALLPRSRRLLRATPRRRHLRNLDPLNRGDHQLVPGAAPTKEHLSRGRPLRETVPQAALPAAATR